jgi:hypothetical protein
MGCFLVFWSSVLQSSRWNLPQRPSQLSTIEKKGAFLLPKIEFSPRNPTSEKIIASFKVFSSFGAIIYQKFEKVSQKKYFLNNFTSNHPIATQISVLTMAKLRQFSHFLQQIYRSVSHPFSKVQTRAPGLFPFVRCSNLHKSKTPIKYDWEGR